jgi:hypothetical protein
MKSLVLVFSRRALEKWPQYKGHLKPDPRDPEKCVVHLNTLEYFIFWTAFYVLRSSQVSGSYHPAAPPRGYGHLTPSFGAVTKVGPLVVLHQSNRNSSRRSCMPRIHNANLGLPAAIFTELSIWSDLNLSSVWYVDLISGKNTSTLSKSPLCQPISPRSH